MNAAANAIAHADFDLGWVPAEAIERVEVVRGPMSSLYGSEALGGVVNVITRSATDEWRGSLTAMGGLREDGRGGETYQIGAYAAGPLAGDRLGLSLFAESRARGNTPQATNGRLSDLEDREMTTGSATLTWTPDAAHRIDLTILAGRDDRYRDTVTISGTPLQIPSRSHSSIWPHHRRPQNVAGRVLRLVVHQRRERRWAPDVDQPVGPDHLGAVADQTRKWIEDQQVLIRNYRALTRRSKGSIADDAPFVVIHGPGVLTGDDLVQKSAPRP